MFKQSLVPNFDLVGGTLPDDLREEMENICKLAGYENAKYLDDNQLQDLYYQLQN